MKKILFLLSIVAMAMMTSCSKFGENDFNCQPDPLVLKGGYVDASISATIPAKMFPRKGVLTVTPVLKYNGEEKVVGSAVTYVGERVKTNGKKVSYKNGGKFTQTCHFAFEPAMAQSELYLRFDAKVGKKVVEIPDYKVADGIITTPNLVNARDNKATTTPSKYQQIIEELQEADIKFVVAQSNLRQSELKSEGMQSLENAIKDANADDHKLINKVEISGYASPEGGLDINERLSVARQANTEKYIKGKVGEDAEYLAYTTAEDWEGFQKMVEASDIQDKDLVLRVLSMYEDPEEREAQIRNLSSVFKDIANDILPQLRRSRIMITTAVIGKSGEELLQIAKETPDSLNVEEYLFAAAQAPKAEQEAMYKDIAARFNDYRAYNNLATLYFEQGKNAEAKEAVDHALALEPKNADVNYNAGLIALADGNIKDAETYFGKAAGTKADLNAAMGQMYTMKGDYAKATKAYGTTQSNNAALQLILNEDYAAAQATLNNVAAPNATTAYLKAVLAARTNDREALYLNLRAAIAQDASLKAKAQIDREFSKYAEDATFQSIVK